MAAGMKKFTLILTAIAAALLFTQSAEAAYSRIISLYPGHTDNIIALGGASRLVAISRNDDRTTLPSLPRFTGKSGAEELLALKPDLVLTRGLAERQNPQLRSVLERAGVRVESIEPPSWEGFGSYLKRLAALIGKDGAEAEARLIRLRAGIANEAKKLSKGRSPRVFVEATEKELYTCSPDSWAAKLTALAGGRNVAAEAKPVRAGSSVAPWGLERILKAAHKGGIEVYLIQQGAMNGASAKSALARPWFAPLKKAKLAVIPEGELSRPSLLGLEAGGRKLLSVFYER